MAAFKFLQVYEMAQKDETSLRIIREALEAGCIPFETSMAHEKLRYRLLMLIEILQIHGQDAGQFFWIYDL